MVLEGTPGRLDDDACFRALVARDRRFDGWFFVGVTSTRIYCRPSCPSVMPKRQNARFFPTAAGAQRAGFRACKRCRPDGVPGSPEWNRRGDAVGRAMRLIADGVVDREGVNALAGRLGFSSRHLQRVLVSELGAGPLELARAKRCESARILLETTAMRLGEVAFAAGFGSIRQFNDTIRQVYGEVPSALRRRSGALAASGAGGRRAASAAVTLRLPYRAPLGSEALFGFLAARAVPGVEEGGPGWYRRALDLPHGPGVVTVRTLPAGEAALHCRLELEDSRDLGTAVQRTRRLFDLDCDPGSVAEVLRTCPLLGGQVKRLPGLRTPGHVEGNELAVRAVLGQQVSVPGARTLSGKLAEAYGEPLPVPVDGVARLFPSAAVLAALSPEDLPLPTTRAVAVIRLCGALADGSVSLDPGADRDRAAAELLSIPGIGPWTVGYVRMRALGDPDAFLPTDLGAMRALERLGASRGEKAVLALAESWRPYRSYALQYLWSVLATPGETATATAGATTTATATAVPGATTTATATSRAKKEKEPT